MRSWEGCCKGSRNYKEKEEGEGGGGQGGQGGQAGQAVQGGGGDPHVGSTAEEDLKGCGHSFTDSWLARLEKNIRKWLQRLIWVNP